MDFWQIRSLWNLLLATLALLNARLAKKSFFQPKDNRTSAERTRTPSHPLYATSESAIEKCCKEK